MRLIRKLAALMMLELMLVPSAWAARSYICGFEMGSLGEIFSTTGAVSIQSTTKRTGSYALEVHTSNNTGSVTFESRFAGGSFRSIFQSVRFYLYVATNPFGGTVYVLGNPSSTQDVLIFDANGFLEPSPGTCVTKPSVTSNVWHSIAVQNVDSTHWHFSIDGVDSTCTGNIGSGVASSSATLGLFGSNTTGDVFFDDVMFDDGSTTIGAGQSILVKPTTDPASLNSWTGGAGGTTNLWDAVNNVPPVGVIDSSATNTSQIRNAASGGSLNYVATTQSYQTAGVGASDTINGVMAITNDCFTATTGNPKSGGVWIASNPAQTAPGNTFDYGDSSSTVCGTFPTGWTTHTSAVSTSGVTIGSTATVGIQKTTSTTRVVDADILGIYVDYTPAAVGGGVKRLPVLGIGAWLMTWLDSMFSPAMLYAGMPPNKLHDTVDADLLGIYVDYTPAVATPLGKLTIQSKWDK